MTELGATRFAEFLTRSLDLLLRECPVHFTAARTALSGRAAVVRVGGEPALRVCLEDAPWVTAGDAGDITIALDARLLDVLLRGEATLEESVEDGRLSVRGELADLTRFLDALHAWLHGALRSERLADLHAAYLGTEQPVHPTKGNPSP